MKKISILVFLALCSVSVSPLYAAKLFLESTGTSTKDGSITLFVKLDTESTTVNSLDGSIVLAGMKDQVLDIYTGGSAFTLWPNKPSLSGNVISFTGGVPQGIQGSDLLLFSVVVKPKTPSTSYVDFRNIIAYTNDQQDTPTPLVQKPVSLSSLPVKSQIPQDITQPLPFSIELAQESTLFDGKYFISFNTSDTGTGVSHYEVQEGVNPPVRSGSPYVLQDQSRKSTITVTAVDRDGNKQSSTLSGKTFSFIPLITIVFLLGGVILYVQRRKW